MGIASVNECQQGMAAVVAFRQQSLQPYWALLLRMQLIPSLCYSRRRATGELII